MEEKINIAEILKDKPVNTKLYSPLFSEVYFSTVNQVNGDYIAVEHHGVTSVFLSSGKFYDYDESEPLLFPSKEMRDWRKFNWKKGDVLVSKDNVYIIFEKFEDDAYTRFKGKHYLWKECDEEDYNKEKTKMLTSVFEKANDDAAQTYINTIEKRLCGKLNLETLEIEKQPEFKDGDILYAEKDESHTDAIFILRIVKERRKDYACLILNKCPMCDYSGFGIIGNKTLRYATEEEKRQLFDALAKKGKAWDAEKKQIVDLKPKWTPKPFDRVITRGDDDSIWTANIFSHIDRYGQYVTIGCIGGYPYCIPYNEETAKLIGTTDDWKG